MSIDTDGEKIHLRLGSNSDDVLSQPLESFAGAAEGIEVFAEREPRVALADTHVLLAIEL